MNKIFRTKKGTIDMKKLAAIFLSLVMVLSLAACGNSSSNETSAPETSDSAVSQEYYDESLRDVELVADTVENWDSYDTVFIGYPKMEQGYICV